MGKIDSIIKKAESAMLLAYDVGDIWLEPHEIPPRQWIYDKHYIRRFISVTVAPGGAGKTSLSLCEAIAMASGRALIGPTLRQKYRVLYWNGEDPLEEIQRRRAALCKQYDVARSELTGQLFLSSGREAGARIQIAEEDKRGILHLTDSVEKIEQLIRVREIDVAIIDPFVRTHGVSENDNQKINVVAEAFAQIADQTGCAIELVHHARKPTGDGEYTVLDGRGASALHAAARSMRVLNPMSEKEATKAGLRAKQRGFYFRVDIGKSNMAKPPENARWYHLTSVFLGNQRDGEAGDEVAAVTEYTWPVAENITEEKILKVQEALSVTDYRANPQAADWAGYEVAKVLGIELLKGDEEDLKINKKTVSELIKQWTKIGYLAVVEKRDPVSRKKQPVLKVKMRANDPNAPM